MTMAGQGSDVLPASRDVATAAARASSDKQADDIVILDVQDRVRERLGVRPVRREGEAGAGWWLLDYVDVVVHVFGTEERSYYDLERLWSDAPRVGWEDGSKAASAG